MSYVHVTGHTTFVSLQYRDFVNNSRSTLKAQMSYVHVTGHTTFVSLQFSQKQVLWT